MRVDAVVLVPVQSAVSPLRSPSALRPFVPSPCEARTHGSKCRNNYVWLDAGVLEAAYVGQCMGSRLRTAGHGRAAPVSCMHVHAWRSHGQRQRQWLCRGPCGAGLCCLADVLVTPLSRQVKEKRWVT